MVSTGARVGDGAPPARMLRGVLPGGFSAAPTWGRVGYRPRNHLRTRPAGQEGLVVRAVRVVVTTTLDR